MRRDDRQDLPVELGEALDQQVAPGADATHDVGVGALGRQQDPARRGAASASRRAARAAPAGVGLTRPRYADRVAPAHGAVAIAVALRDLGAAACALHGDQGIQLAFEGDHRPLDLLADLQQRLADEQAFHQQLLDVVADAVAVGLGRRERARATDQPADVGALVLGGLQPGVLLAQQQQLGAHGGEASTRPPWPGRVGPAAEAPARLVASAAPAMPRRSSPALLGRRCLRPSCRVVMSIPVRCIVHPSRSVSSVAGQPFTTRKLTAWEPTSPGRRSRSPSGGRPAGPSAWRRTGR